MAFAFPDGLHWAGTAGHLLRLGAVVNGIQLVETVDPATLGSAGAADKPTLGFSWGGGGTAPAIEVGSFQDFWTHDEWDTSSWHFAANGPCAVQLTRCPATGPYPPAAVVLTATLAAAGIVSGSDVEAVTEPTLWRCTVTSGTATAAALGVTGTRRA